MYILYVDESGDAGLTAKSSRHYVLAGVAMFEGAWRKLSTKLDDVQQKYFPLAAGRVEFHFKEIHHRRGIFAQLDESKNRELITDISSIWETHRPDFTSFAVVLDKHSSGGIPDLVESYVFEQLVSRFNYFLKRIWKGNPHKGIIVFDRKTKTQDRIIQQLQSKFQSVGTRWASLDNVIETVFTLDSTDSRLLQMADFLAGALFQLVENANDQFLKPLAPFFDSEIQPDGKSVKIHGFKYLGRDAKTKTLLRSVGLV